MSDQNYIFFHNQFTHSQKNKKKFFKQLFKNIFQSLKFCIEHDYIRLCNRRLYTALLASNPFRCCDLGRSASLQAKQLLQLMYSLPLYLDQEQSGHHSEPKYLFISELFPLYYERLSHKLLYALKYCPICQCSPDETSNPFLARQPSFQHVPLPNFKKPSVEYDNGRFDFLRRE